MRKSSGLAHLAAAPVSTCHVPTLRNKIPHDAVDRAAEVVQNLGRRVFACATLARAECGEVGRSFDKAGGVVQREYKPTRKQWWRWRKPQMFGHFLER
jgi:hypothetical protein